MANIPEKAQSYVQGWCQLQDWSDPFIENSQVYALPKGAVIPQVTPGSGLLLRDDCFPCEPKFTPEQANSAAQMAAAGRKLNAASYQSAQSFNPLGLD